MEFERISSSEERLPSVNAAGSGSSIVPSPAFSERAVEHSQTRASASSALLFTFQSCAILKICMSVVRIFQTDHRFFFLIPSEKSKSYVSQRCLKRRVM